MRGPGSAAPATTDAPEDASGYFTDQIENTCCNTKRFPTKLSSPSKRKCKQATKASFRFFCRFCGCKLSVERQDTCTKKTSSTQKSNHIPNKAAQSTQANDIQAPKCNCKKKLPASQLRTDKPQDIVILETIDEAKEASGSEYGNANDEAPYNEWESEDDLDDNSSTAAEICQQSDTQGQKTQSKHSRALKLRDLTDRIDWCWLFESSLIQVLPLRMVLKLVDAAWNNHANMLYLQD
ncbi:hypothetical protein PtB15_12B275 [Puccinia triticina]|nr:hypothetical protein PtB15_12B275 [Puccinia triticina]